MSEGDHSWQLNKSVLECNQHMLDNEVATDVTFIVSHSHNDSDSTKRISAHRYVLISRSPVFHAMLLGPLAEKGDIRVTDTEPQAFRQMLQYIYTEDVTIDSENLMNMLYLSNKYMFPGLSEKCTKYLSKKLDASNACLILDQTLLFQEEEITKLCMKYVKNETESVFKSESFMDISQRTLSKILDAQCFKIAEIKVFEYCLSWAKYNCEKQKLEICGNNLRQILSDCVGKIRFPLLSSEELATYVSPADILTGEEENSLFRFICNRKIHPPPKDFSSEKRYYKPPTDIQVEVNAQTKQVNIGSIDIELNIISDKDLEITAFVIGGSFKTECDPCNSYHITMLQDISLDHSTGEEGVHDNRRSGVHIWLLTKTILIKTGENKVFLQYKNSHYDSDACPGMGTVTVLPNKNLHLRGNDVDIKLKSSKNFMPVFGLQYLLEKDRW